MTTAPFGFLRLAAACPPVRVADPEANVDATLACIEQAASRGAQVLVLPELGLTVQPNAGSFPAPVKTMFTIRKKR